MSRRIHLDDLIVKFSALSRIRVVVLDLPARKVLIMMNGAIVLKSHISDVAINLGFVRVTEVCANQTEFVKVSIIVDNPSEHSRRRHR